MTLLQHSGPALTGEQREQLAARAIPVAAGPVEAIEAGPAGLTGVRLAAGAINYDLILEETGQAAETRHATAGQAA